MLKLTIAEIEYFISSHFEKLSPIQGVHEPFSLHLNVPFPWIPVPVQCAAYREVVKLVLRDNINGRSFGFNRSNA